VLLEKLNHNGDEVPLFTLLLIFGFVRTSSSVSCIITHMQHLMLLKSMSMVLSASYRSTVSLHRLLEDDPRNIYPTEIVRVKIEEQTLHQLFL
jgi:hypothetical protein